MTWSEHHDTLLRTKAHSVDTALLELLKEDLATRYGAEFAPEYQRENEETSFEPGGYGMYYLHQPKIVFTLGTKKLTIDKIKVDELLFELQAAKAKRFSDGTIYYKLYSRFHCLVLSCLDREQLLDQIAKQIETIREEANLWLEAREKIHQVSKLKYEAEQGKNSFPLIRAQDLSQPN